MATGGAGAARDNAKHGGSKGTPVRDDALKRAMSTWCSNVVCRRLVVVVTECHLGCYGICLDDDRPGKP